VLLQDLAGQVLCHRLSSPRPRMKASEHTDNRSGRTPYPGICWAAEQGERKTLRGLLNVARVSIGR
jgi:hypothetical protein